MKTFKNATGFCKTFLCILFICCLHIQIQAQIINIESRRIITDTVGWSGDLGISVSASKAAKSFFTFNGKGHLQFKTNKDLFLAILNYNLVHAGGEDFGNSGFGHLRYNRKLSSLLFKLFFHRLCTSGKPFCTQH